MFIPLKDCIEKQTAKPVTATKDEMMLLYRCPRCYAGLAFRVGKEVIGNRNSYCGDCGQKLDWSVI